MCVILHSVVASGQACAERRRHCANGRETDTEDEDRRSEIGDETTNRTLRPRRHSATNPDIDGR